MACLPSPCIGQATSYPWGSTLAIRPPWMAEVPELQEHFPALASDGPTQGLGKHDEAYRA